MYTAVTVMGRSSTAAKYLNVSIWLCRGIRTSRIHSSSNVRSLGRLYSQQAHQKESGALTESKTGGTEISTATAFETGTRNSLLFCSKIKGDFGFSISPSYF